MSRGCSAAARAIYRRSSALNFCRICPIGLVHLNELRGPPDSIFLIRSQARWRWSFVQFLFLAFLLYSPDATATGKQVALVVGNSAYKYAGELLNPQNDAADFAEYLKTLNFEVIVGFDLDKVAFVQKIEEFSRALRGAATGVFFYAGHGLQVSGQNYLVPVDAKLASEVTLDSETVRFDLVQRMMEREAQTKLLFLDACRNNPLARNLARAMGTRSVEIGRGFAPVDSGIGTLISFSTQPGNVALDGQERNSPFTRALLRHLSTSKDDLGSLLIAVRNDVMKDTENRQVPWEHSSLTARFYFTPAAIQHPNQPITSPIRVTDSTLKRDAPAVEIGDFSTHPANDQELDWLKIKIERNFVDLFVDRGLNTRHRSSTFTTGNIGTRISGAIERNSSTEVEIRLWLRSTDDAVLGSTSVRANISTLKENYKSIPEALTYSLGVSPDTLRKVETTRRPTHSFVAMLLYLEAVRHAKVGHFENAFALLQQAVKEDSRFAVARWAGGQVLRALGNEDEARAWEILAATIDPDHPKSSLIDDVANPLPRLRTALQSTEWRPIYKSLAIKSANLDSYKIIIYAWRLDPTEFRLAVANSATEFGSTVAEIRLAHQAILAVNGGFFDIDRQSRLSPTGLLIINGKQMAPITAKTRGGSGIIFSRDGTVDIDFIENTNSLEGIEAAVQVGPLVVDPGGKNGIRKNDFDRQNRGVICRQAQGTLVVVIVEGGLSLHEVGELLASGEHEGGFGCDRALNLDGGPSTQASFALADHSLEIQGRWKVPNALLFLPK